jgi:hypothetical protein
MKNKLIKLGKESLKSTTWRPTQTFLGWGKYQSNKTKAQNNKKGKTTSKVE